MTRLIGTWKLTVIALLILASAGLSAGAAGGSTIRIMTQNMDQGTGEGYIVAAASGAIPELSLADAVDLTFAELKEGHLEQRAGLIAGKIAEQDPDIVALQEVTLWRTGPSPAAAVIPVYDQLTFLLLELLKRGEVYYPIAVNTAGDLTLPGNKIGALRVTSRNVLLARLDRRLPAVYFTGVHTEVFSNSLNIFGLQVKSGWLSATVHQGDKRFLLVATHLQSAVPGYPPAIAVQVAQTQELLNALRYTSDPVILCGDFNSDANGNPGVLDYTPTADNIRAAGYSEVWGTLRPGDLGNTWPLYIDDQIPISFPATTPFERIDLFFERGIQPLQIEKLIAPAPTGFTPPFGSDHAGVIATFKF
jgi:endonuclease/exonuclease/phosphatase (EEP) superfamily protein YafD